MNEFKSHVAGLSKEEIEKIKKAVFLLQLSRKSKDDHQLFHAIVEGVLFPESVTPPLKELVGWDKKDDLIIKELFEKLDREISGKGLKEKFFYLREKVQKIFQSPNFHTAIKVGALAAAVTATGLVINHFKKTKEKDDPNAKK
ncbi:MAG: hypothetical protein V1892_00485 [bacterium]